MLPYAIICYHVWSETRIIRQTMSDTGDPNTVVTQSQSPRRVNTNGWFSIVLTFVAQISTVEFTSTWPNATLLIVFYLCIFSSNPLLQVDTDSQYSLVLFSQASSIYDMS